MTKLIPLLLLLSGCCTAPCEHHDSPLDPANRAEHVSCDDPTSGSSGNCGQHGWSP